MSEGEVKKCPKCRGDMEIGYLDGAYNWNRGTSHWQFRPGPRIWAYACKNCGYVEFYVGKRVKP